MILKNIPEGAEVLEIVAHLPGTAWKVGAREADKRTKRGFPYKCVGVVESVKQVDSESYTVDAEGFSHETPSSRELHGYQPVLLTTE